MGAIVADLVAWRLNRQRHEGRLTASAGKSGAAPASDAWPLTVTAESPDDDLLSALDRIENAALDLRRLIVKSGLITVDQPLSTGAVRRHQAIRRKPTGHASRAK